MDRETLIGLVERRHHIRLPPDDPTLVLATIAEVMQGETKAELQRIMSEALDQVSAANVQIENAAKAKVEGIVTEAGRWAAERIREAGETAAAAVLAERQKVDAQIERLSAQLRWALWVSALCAAGSLGMTIAVVLGLTVG